MTTGYQVGRPSNVITDASSLLVTATGSATARTLAKRAADVVNVLDYLPGNQPDGTTDNTSGIQAAINTAGVNGGVVYFPAGTYRVDGQLTFPNSGETKPRQKPIRLIGAGYWADTAEGPGSPPYGGTILDMRYSGAQPAKIDTRGRGFLEIAHIALRDEGGDSVPFVQTTNTVLWIHDCAFFGLSTLTGATGTTNQDAIILGGTTTTEDGGASAPFQGYGTVIERCHFDRLRRGVYVRRYGNGVIIRDNVWWLTNGSDSTAGAIELDGGVAPGVQGIVIQGNIIESAYYAYPIKFTLATNCSIIGNGFYDITATTIALIRFESGSGSNLVIHGLSNVSGGTVPVSDANGTNAFIQAKGNTLLLGDSAKAASIGAKGVATGGGVGLLGASDSGYGIQGTTTSASLAAIEGANSSTGAGVHGSSGATGVLGSTNSAFYGVKGDNAGSGKGVYGVSSTGRGVEGNVSNSSEAVAGVQAGAGIALYGSSQAGRALVATSTGSTLAALQASGVDKFTVSSAGFTNQGGHRMEWAAAAPGSGTWAQGDVVWNTGATAGGSPGWVCTTGGAPGTWKAMANVAA